MRRLFCAVAFVVVSSALAAQSLTFEVASVKQNRDDSGSLRGGSCIGTNSTAVITTLSSVPADPTRSPMAPGSCRFGRTTLKEIVAAAYAVPRRDFERLIVGGPAWFDRDRFDIEAKAEKPLPQAELERMLQALLADRFGLRLHRETRQVDGYSLVAARGGAKLKPVESAAPGRIRTTRGSLTAVATTMARLAQVLSTPLGQPVVDDTGLSGSYDFMLTWTPSASETNLFSPLGGSTLPDPGEASVFTAMDEQLGLRLQPRKVETEMLVIDAANHPSPN
jgi:uncharacterized protein (TIGR03435 family)